MQPKASTPWIPCSKRRRAQEFSHPNSAEVGVFAKGNAGWCRLAVLLYHCCTREIAPESLLCCRLCGTGLLLLLVYTHIERLNLRQPENWATEKYFALLGPELERPAAVWVSSPAWPKPCGDLIMRTKSPGTTDHQEFWTRSLGYQGWGAEPTLLILLLSAVDAFTYQPNSVSTAYSLKRQ